MKERYKISKRHYSDDSFTSMMAKTLDKFIEALLKDDAPNGPTSKEILDALNEMEGLDEETKKDLFDILTTNIIKFESLLLFPVERRKRWFLN